MVSFIVVCGVLVCNFKNLYARFLPHVGQKKGDRFWRDKLFHVILYLKNKFYVCCVLYVYVFRESPTNWISHLFRQVIAIRSNIVHTIDTDITT